MNIEDLMAVWRSQDVSPLHGVNETLLRLALRQGEANMRFRRRLEKGVTYLVSACLIAAMVLLLGLMIRNSDGLTGWDFVLPIVGAFPVLLWPRFLQRNFQVLARSEQRFGDSLRDQLNRQITQLDFHLSRVDQLAHHLYNNVWVIIWSAALFFTTLRIRGKPFSHVWNDPRTLITAIVTLVLCTLTCVFGIWLQRRMVKWELLPRKRQLEALLKELDGQ